MLWAKTQQASFQSRNSFDKILIKLEPDCHEGFELEKSLSVYVDRHVRKAKLTLWNECYIAVTLGLLAFCTQLLVSLIHE